MTDREGGLLLEMGNRPPRLKPGGKAMPDFAASSPLLEIIELLSPLAGFAR